MFDAIRQRVVEFVPVAQSLKPTYREFRAGDVLHSLADIAKAKELLGYEAKYSVGEGLDLAAHWYVSHL